MIKLNWNGRFHSTPQAYAQFCREHSVPVIIALPQSIPVGSLVTYCPEHYFVAKVVRQVCDSVVEPLIRRFGPGSGLQFSYELEALD